MCDDSETSHPYMLNYCRFRGSTMKDETHTEGVLWDLFTLSNIARVEFPGFGKVLPSESFPQQDRGLHDIFLGQDPGAPVYAECSLTLGIEEDVYTIIRVCVPVVKSV